MSHSLANSSLIRLKLNILNTNITKRHDMTTKKSGQTILL